jgi:hypothetical protein
VDEHVFAAVVANDEAESLLRIEEFDDALAFADDLGRHSAAASAATAEAAATTTTTTEATASAAAVAAAAVTVATSAAESPAPAAAIATAFLESATEIAAECFFAETFALITTAAAAVSLAPSVKTHASSNFRAPTK